MKKFRVLLTVVAVVTAVAFVYAKENVFSTIYYEDLPTVQGTCNQQITLPCTEGTSIPCTINGGHNVWKQVDGGACEQVFKDAQ